MKTYDYIILGAGAAGLSLAYRMSQDPYFEEKTIAVIDKDEKNKNDRTWCFWEKKKGVFDSVVKKRWSSLKFYSINFERSMTLNPYTYKMISGLDFYNYVLNHLRKKSNIDIITEEVVKVVEEKTVAFVNTTQNSYQTSQIFKSYPENLKEIASSTNHPFVYQHFKGYFIETTTDYFDPDEATFMDFRIDQKGETRFLYVLPESSTKALVEVAIFSNSILAHSEYNQVVENYIKEYLYIDNYSLLEEEFGIIPMTTYPFHQHNTNTTFHIGTGGSIVKASSGYAFSRIQKHSDQLINCIKNNEPLNKSYDSLMGRFAFYDKIMLNAILEDFTTGKEVFTKIFKNLDAQHVFKFLDQETSFIGDLKTFTAPPTFPFIKSLFDLIKK